MGVCCAKPPTYVVEEPRKDSEVLFFQMKKCHVDFMSQKRGCRHGNNCTFAHGTTSLKRFYRKP
eukprot:UN18812